MVSFYSFSREFRIFMGLLGAVTVIEQSRNVIYCTRRSIWKSYYIRIGFEYALLGYTIMLSGIPSMLNFLIRDGFLPFTLLEKERVVLFSIVVVFALIGVVRSKKLFPVGIILPLIITLPYFEKYGDKYFQGLLFVMVYLLLRSFFLVLSNRICQSKSISRWSIKEAIDKLHSGILFCRSNGGILLINRKMKLLMTELTGEKFRDGLHFFEKLRENEKINTLEEEEREYFIFHTKDDKYWKFSKEDIQIGRKRYIEIDATDITEQWNLIEQIKIQNKELSEKKMQLQSLVENMFEIQREQERNRLRGRIHDLLGQRITVFQRWLQNGEKPTLEQIFELLNTLETEIAEEDNESDEQILQSIVQIFEQIGVEIEIEGKLPTDLRCSQVFVSIIREASTNAVRHGLATNVKVEFSETEAEFILSVKNNGIIPKEEIIDGTGITTMKSRLKKVGGGVANTATQRIYTPNIHSEIINIHVKGKGTGIKMMNQRLKKYGGRLEIQINPNFFIQAFFPKNRERI